MNKNDREQERPVYIDRALLTATITHQFCTTRASMCSPRERWLGHANVNTTLSIYAHLSKEKEMKNVDKLAGIFEKVAKRLPDKACEEKETPENA